MKIHEYQAKALFAKYNVPIPKGAVAFDVEAAKTVAQDLGAFPVVVKAQIHAGRRGKGGGVKPAQSLDEEDPLEVEASKYHLNYINLGGAGNVGNMVNGAGLAMATMDIIKLAGSEPANFPDAGGGADEEMVENGFKIILSDPHVKAILINIFGGILRCDVLATGVVNAFRKVGLNVPVVVRMEGTNVEEGRKILADSDPSLITAVDLKDAANKIAEAVSS